MTRFGLNTCHDGLGPLLSPRGCSGFVVLPAVWVTHIQSTAVQIVWKLLMVLLVGIYNSNQETLQPLSSSYVDFLCSPDTAKIKLKYLMSSTMQLHMAGCNQFPLPHVACYCFPLSFPSCKRHEALIWQKIKTLISTSVQEELSSQILVFTEVN